MKNSELTFYTLFLVVAVLTASTLFGGCTEKEDVQQENDVLSPSEDVQENEGEGEGEEEGEEAMRKAVEEADAELIRRIRETNTDPVWIISGGYSEDEISFEGASALPDGSHIRTRLLFEGEPVNWWPSEPSVVRDKGWNVSVRLGEENAPEELEEGVYSLEAWEEGKPDEKKVFVLDLEHSPAPEMEGPRPEEI